MKNKLISTFLNVILKKIEQKNTEEYDNLPVARLSSKKEATLTLVEKLNNLGCTCEWYKNEDHMGQALPLPRKTGFLTLSLNKDLKINLRHFLEARHDSKEDCPLTYPCYVVSKKRDFAVLIPEELAMHICTLEHLP